MKRIATLTIALLMALGMVAGATAQPPAEVLERGNEQSAQRGNGVQKYAHCHQIDGFANQGEDAVYILKYLPLAALNAGNAHGENTSLTECMSEEQFDAAVERGQVLDGNLDDFDGTAQVIGRVD